MEELQTTQETCNEGFRGIWNNKWVRPFESLWSLINTYKTVNVITSTATAMKSLGVNIKYKVKDYYLRYGIYCNVSPNQNDVEKVILTLSPEWHREQLQSMFDKNGVHMFISKKLMICPKCMENGYHSVLHQLKRIKKCPFHSDVNLVTYFRQEYMFGNQSSYEYDRENGNKAMILFSRSIIASNRDFESGNDLKLPTDWCEMPELEEFSGIKNDYDVIRAIGGDIYDRNIIPEIGYFLLKANIQVPCISLNNVEDTNKFVLEKLQERLLSSSLKLKNDALNIDLSILTILFKYYFAIIVISDMLKPYTVDEIDYKCYQIERGRDIICTDDLGIKLLFLLYLTGEDNAEDVFKDFVKLIDPDSDYMAKFEYYPSDICIVDLDLNEIPISAQYYILQEYISMNWSKFKNYAMKNGTIRRENFRKDIILYPGHLIYVEQNKIINVYRS